MIRPRVDGWQRSIGSCLVAALLLAGAAKAGAHGTLVNGRMYQVRVHGEAGGTPAPWNGDYYTWNQDSNNFTQYAAPGFSYSMYVPDGTIASAGKNNGTNNSLNFSGLNTPSAGWATTAAKAGSLFDLHWVATAPHDPSFFDVFITKPGFDPTTQTLGWSNLTELGKWSFEDPNMPVTKGTGKSPADGSTLLSYDWSVPIPTNLSGRATIVVVWQREDPAGEAFFAVQDIMVTAVPEPGSALLLLVGVGVFAGGKRWRARRCKLRG